MTNTTIEDALKQEAAALERVLAERPEFQRLNVIRRTLMELQNIKIGPSRSANLFESTSPAALGYRQAGSITQATEFAIEDEKRPLTTRELLGILPRYGKAPGGANPATNLSNNLSSDRRFDSLPYRGLTAWWLSRLGSPPT